MSYDLLIRGATVVAATVARLDLAVADGVIAALAPELTGPAREYVDGRGLHVLPGVIDAHVHFNEPGRTDWEGFASGTRALAAGGATAAIEMPLNASPPTVDAAGFAAKRLRLERSALVDVGLWGGLVPGRLAAMDELAACGVFGFKAFMCDSGVADFPAADDLTLYEGMCRAAAVGLPVAVHAENQTITAGLAARARAAGRRGVRDFLDSRPVAAELEAVARVAALAEASGCAAHIVHVSSGRAVALVAAARARGVDISCETAPHYLVLTEEDAERLGAVAKCAPPLRSAREREALWQAVSDGTLPMIASDHSPSPWPLKQPGDAFAAWGGISGCQTLLALVLDEGHRRRALSLERLSAATSGYVARRFRVPGKGRLEPGADADLAVVSLEAAARLRSEDLHYRHRHSPFVGRELHARVVRTIARGRTVFADGRILGRPSGRLLQPAPHAPPQATVLPAAPPPTAGVAGP